AVDFGAGKTGRERIGRVAWDAHHAAAFHVGQHRAHIGAVVGTHDAYGLQVGPPWIFLWAAGRAHYAPGRERPKARSSFTPARGGAQPPPRLALCPPTPRPRALGPRCAKAPCAQVRLGQHLRANRSYRARPALLASCGPVPLPRARLTSRALPRALEEIVAAS